MSDEDRKTMERDFTVHFVVCASRARESSNEA